MSKRVETANIVFGAAFSAYFGVKLADMPFDWIDAGRIAFSLGLLWFAVTVFSKDRGSLHPDARGLLDRPTVGWLAFVVTTFLAYETFGFDGGYFLPIVGMWLLILAISHLASDQNAEAEIDD